MLFIHIFHDVADLIEGRFGLVVGVKESGIGGVTVSVMVLQAKESHIGDVGGTAACGIQVLEHQKDTAVLLRLFFKRFLVLFVHSDGQLRNLDLQIKLCKMLDRTFQVLTEG